MQRQVIVTGIVRSRGHVAYSTADTNGRWIVGRVQANTVLKPDVFNMTLKQSEKVRNGSQKIPRKPKNKENSTNNQTMLITFFDAKGIIHKEFVHTG
ncbi:hypothetical protein TNCV_67441 [Trichonephila clavipes]|nr:hypothetical protein TNCV_67441 [Trichonephila clavipes]